jgi:hypothetical protein
LSAQRNLIDRQTHSKSALEGKTPSNASSIHSFSPEHMSKHHTILKEDDPGYDTRPKRGNAQDLKLLPTKLNTNQVSHDLATDIKAITGTNSDLRHHSKHDNYQDHD